MVTRIASFNAQTPLHKKKSQLNYCDLPEIDGTNVIDAKVNRQISAA